MEAIQNYDHTTSCFITQNDAYLSEYQTIVSRHYRDELGIELDKDSNNWNVSAIKHSGKCMIAMNTQQVIGGTMLYTSSGTHRKLLPLEGGKAILSKYSGQDLASVSYGEIGRLAIKKENRSMELVTRLIGNMIDYARCSGLQYVFVLAPGSNAILYRRVARNINLKITLSDFPAGPAPEIYQHLDLKLICAFPQEPI